MSCYYYSLYVQKGRGKHKDIKRDVEVFFKGKTEFLKWILQTSKMKIQWMGLVTD